MRFVKNITSKRHFIIAGSILISFFSVLVLDLFLNSLNERPNIRQEIFFIAFVTGIIVFFTNTWSMKHVFQSINILTDTIKGVIRGKKAIKFPVFPNSELHNLSISIQKLSEINTKLEKKTEQVQHASQQKDMFISSMSHELRTPLNAIIGYSEMLQDEASEANNTEWGEDIRKIHVAGEYLLGMVNNILDISKIEAGKMTVFLEEFNIDTMLSDIRDIANTLMKKNNNTFVMDTPKEIGSMVSDLMKVRQSILNFLSNAAKFTENGVVTLRCQKKQEEKKEWVYFDVIDTGIGMTPEQVQRIFQPFQQAEASTTKKFGGTGLGLTITKGFCEMLGGEISVQSESGKGSIFSIKLPVETKDSEKNKASRKQKTVS